MNLGLSEKDILKLNTMYECDNGDAGTFNFWRLGKGEGNVDTCSLLISS